MGKKPLMHKESGFEVQNFISNNEGWETLEECSTIAEAEFLADNSQAVGPIRIVEIHGVWY